MISMFKKKKYMNLILAIKILRFHADYVPDPDRSKNSEFTIARQTVELAKKNPGIFDKNGDIKTKKGA